MTSRQQEQQTSSSSTPEKAAPANNNNNNNKQNPPTKTTKTTNPRPLSRKRSSIQSNMSSLATNGSGHGSLHSSSSTATSGDDLEERPVGETETGALDYEHARNTTLLFFLDRLYLASQEGKEARTLQELTNSFNSKEFTKDMRRIVASRNGLKKFLQSYPSLFHIEHDKVFLTQLKHDTSGANKRDYNQEAVDYFKTKLLQFGTSLVPIKNLFGYRSQASQDVRHVSGKNTHDFKNFLKRNELVFEILADEHVVLKSALAELESQGQTSLVLEQSLQPAQADEAIVSDPYLNKQFAHLIEQCIKTMRAHEMAANKLSEDKQDEFRVDLEVLHEQIQKQCQNEIFLKMVKSRESLKMFLRMHPKLFKRFNCDQGRDCVALISEQERKQLELLSLAHRQSILQRQHSTLAGRPSETKPEPIKSNQQPQHPVEASACRPRNELERDLCHSLAPMSQAAAAAEVASNQRASSKEEAEANSKRQQARHSKTSAASQQLRAAAPPFVPSSKPTSQHQNGANKAMQGSNSNLTSNSRPTHSSAATAAHETRHAPLQASLSNGHAPVDQRQAIRSYLMQSNQTSHHNMNWTQNKRQTNEPALVAAPGAASNERELRARTVDMVREASNIITRIMSTSEAVAFDCKGYNLGFDGQITLIQFGYLPSTKKEDPMQSMYGEQEEAQESTLDGRVKPEVCVFDLITNPELAYCLKPLLESDKIVKIVHDVRNKSNALHVQFKITLKNVFDTQVANLVVQQQDTGKPAYKSRYISMSKLCEIYGDEQLMKYRNIIKHRTRHAGQKGAEVSSRGSKDVNYWRIRPLTKPMIFEATMDVYCLVGGIYQNLRSRIKPEYEPLFKQLNLEGILARIRPEEIRSAKKERKIDLEAIDLKRKLYSKTTGPVVLSNREIRLLRHIDLNEEVRQKIQQCKKVAKKLERLDMKAAQLREQQEGSPQSLASSNSSSSNNNSNNNININNNSIDQPDLSEQQRAQFASKMDEFQATGLLTNLLDSSMFDELKDKMIESSSLLESLEDDDDDECLNTSHLSSGSQHSHNGSLNHDCCGCQCHRNSIDRGETAQKSPNLERANESTTSASAVRCGTKCDEAAKNTLISGDSPKQSTELESRTDSTGATSGERVAQEDVEQATNGQQDEDTDSKSSLACDMAVQCDLLS